MNILLSKVEVADVIAVVILLGGFLLKLKGVDGEATAMLVGISAYYFGRKIRKDPHPELGEE